MDELKKIKVILVGESGVGKTCIIYRYIEDKFNEDTLSSIAMSCAEKKIQLNDKNKTEMLFEIWDTCGQEKYRHLSKLYFKDAKAAILVYDTTSKSSFNDIKNYWYNNVKENSSEDIIFAVAGNKSDLFDKEQVKEEEGKKYSEEINSIFEIISAYNGVGINELFNNIGLKCLNLKEDENKIGNLKLVNPKNTNIKQNNGRCCY